MQDDNRGRIAKNTGFLYLRMIVVMLVSLYTSRIILRTLGFEDFGIYNVVGSVVTFLSFFQAALRNATFRYLTFEMGAGNIDKISKVFSMSINTHLILAIILFVLMEIGGVWLINNKLVITEDRLIAANWAYQFSLLTFCITIIRTPYDSCIIAYEKMDFYALTSIVEVALKLLIVYLLIIVPFDKLIVYAILLTMVTVLLSLWYVVYCKRKFPDCKYIKYWDKDMLKQFTSYSGWSLLVNGATITRTQCISIFFNLFLGVLANAALGIANQVVSSLNMFVTNFTQAFRPQIIKSWAAKDYDYFMKLIFSSSKMAYFLLLIISIPIVVNIDFVLKVWLGEYPPMAPVFIETIILYYLIDAFQEPLITSVHATGNLKYHQIMIATIVFMVIPVSYILLRVGCPGSYVLIANALANVVCAVGRTLYMRRLINLNVAEYLKKVVVPVLAVTLLSLPLPLYMSQRLYESWLNVILICGVSVILTGLSCYFVGLSNSEREILKSIQFVKKVLRK